MRILDELGCVDLPYESTMLAIDDGSVIAHLADGSKILMAQYETIEKAKMALRKLRASYQKAVESERTNLNQHRFEYTNITTEYFQFPTEEDLT